MEATFDDLEKRPTSITREEHFISVADILKDSCALHLEDTPAELLEKLLVLSENQDYHDRLKYVRHLSEFIEKIGEDGVKNLEKIISFIHHDKNDLKLAFLTQVTPLLSFLQKQGEQGYHEIIQAVLPCVVALLHSNYSEVKQESAGKLKDLCEALHPADREKYLLPQIIRIAHDAKNEDNRAIAAKMLSQLAHFFEQHLCEQRLAPELIAMEKDLGDQVQREAVLNLSQLCKTVSHRFFCQKLQPFYLRLCKNHDWDVRQACAQIIYHISTFCENHTKEKELTDTMLSFLRDQSNFVKAQAYKNLGQFISALQDLKVNEKLVNFYIGMIDKNVQHLAPQNDILFSCAYNFPAVVCTLGSSKWPSLLKVFQTLVTSEAKIKKPVACSLHHIAKSIGPDYTAKDLLPVFTEFLRDPDDDVKYGVLQNMSLFFRVFPINEREHLIDLFLDFLKDQIKWREREAIARQLDKFALVFKPETNFTIIAPIGFKLCYDPIAAVREEAAKRIGALFMSLYHRQDSYRDSMVVHIKGFSKSKRFMVRQIFILMCQKLMKNPEIFKVHFLDDFVELGADKILNVRIAVARSLKRLYDHDSPLCEDSQIIKLVSELKKDSCVDVKNELETTIIPVRGLAETTVEEREIPQEEENQGELKGQGEDSSLQSDNDKIISPERAIDSKNENTKTTEIIS